MLEYTALVEAVNDRLDWFQSEYRKADKYEWYANESEREVYPLKNRSNSYFWMGYKIGLKQGYYGDGWQITKFGTDPNAGVGMWCAPFVRGYIRGVLAITERTF